MAPSQDDPGLSVRLEWPDDPVLQPPANARDTADWATVERRLADAREAAHAIDGADPVELAGRVELAVGHILHLLEDLLEAYRGTTEATLEAVDSRIGDLLNAVSLMLDSRLAGDEERQQARQLRLEHRADELEQHVEVRQQARQLRLEHRADELERRVEEQGHVIADHLAALGRQMSDVAKELQERSELQADALATEVRDLRRRIAVTRRGADSTDELVENIVARVADEVEIRLAATMTPKPARRGRS